MNLRGFTGPLLGACIVICGATVALFAEKGWENYSAHDHGYSMLIPSGTSMSEKEWEHGWAGAHGEHEGVEFAGIAKSGSESEADISKFGVDAIGIAQSHWTMIDHGAGNGFKWYKVYEATDGTHVVYAGIGVGSKSSFLLFLKTTTADVAKHKADYVKWYKSLKGS